MLIEYCGTYELNWFKFILLQYICQGSKEGGRDQRANDKSWQYISSCIDLRIMLSLMMSVRQENKETKQNKTAIRETNQKLILYYIFHDSYASYLPHYTYQILNGGLYGIHSEIKDFKPFLVDNKI